MLKCELASGLPRGKLPGMTPFLKASPARGESNTKHDLCNMHRGKNRTRRKVVSSQRYAILPSSFKEAEPVVSNPGLSLHIAIDVPVHLNIHLLLTHIQVFFSELLDS